MRSRPTSATVMVALVPAVAAALLSCAPATPTAQPPRVAETAPVGTPVGTPLDTPADTPAGAPAASGADTVSVTTPKKVAAILDCAAFLPAVAEATGIDAAVKKGESTAELCRYSLPYNRGLTTASIFFRAEPPGTPSYQPTDELFGNTAYQVDGDAGKDCGFSVALDAAKAAHQHGSHLTVLGTYEGREEPCVISKRLTEIVFGLLAAG
ncbi:hypothetical protein ACFPM7_09860 [Actinokineospora guangxiensis]|uniref:DUF3558 domain-containing protein n=1 Tax=Actinokineospora guangxiensis TaxID=1490288 RepID=A0ABW0EN42_9PSEU